MLAYALIDVRESFLSLAEPSHVDWRAYHARVQTLVKGRGAPDAEEARLLREGERIGIWRHVGEPNMLAYVERFLGYGRRCAYDRLRVARALGELPLIEKALAEGELFYSVVRELTRVAVWETEEPWLARAREKSLREVENAVSGRAPGDLPDAPSKPELVRHVHRYEVTAETDALLRQARKALQDELGQPLDDDAFLALVARRALAHEGGVAPRERIAVAVCDRCKRATQDGNGSVVELDAPTLEAMECDADRMDPSGKVSRHIPERTRRLVLQRDHHRCRVPWCRSGHDLVPHHIDHHAHGGTNDIENLITMCWGHHRALHRGRLRLAMDNGEATFERMESVAVPANETSPPMEPSIFETALRALMGLGFKKTEAQSYLEAASAHVGKTASVTELIRDALKRSPSR